MEAQLQFESELNACREACSQLKADLFVKWGIRWVNHRELSDGTKFNSYRAENLDVIAIVIGEEVHV